MNKQEDLTEKLTQYYSDALQSVSFNSDNDEVYYALRYVLSMKGKRLRPVLLLLVNQMFDGELDEAMPAALAVELFHSFTLVHDDIMDKAPVRRGMPTVHVKHGLGTAINTGDLLMIIANKYLSQVKGKLFLDVFRLYTEISVRIMEGQCMDLEYEDRDMISTEEYLSMIEQKTSLLIAFCMQVGSMLAGADEDEQALIFGLGIRLGMSFQLKDDWLDVYGGHKTGKKRGGDIVRNKKTFLYIRAWECASETLRGRLAELRTLRDEEKKISETIKIYDRLQIGAQTEELINDYYSQALGFLDRLEVSGERKGPVYDMLQRLHSREF